MAELYKKTHTIKQSKKQIKDAIYMYLFQSFF